MEILAEILGANIVTRALALCVAVLLSYRWLARMSEELLAVACGLLAAVALTHLIPEAFESPTADPHGLGLAMLATVFVFLLIERAVMHGDHGHSHVHADAAAARSRSAVPVMLAGAAMHNVVDGVLIASTFMMNGRAGWLVALAVICHEVPQTTGYMVILKNAGMSARRALLWCSAAASMAVLGGLAGWGAVSLSHAVLPYALAVSAASFLFITLHSLLPEVFRDHEGRAAGLRQLVLFAAGVILSLAVLGTDHGHDHAHDHADGRPAAETHHHERDHRHADHDADHHHEADHRHDESHSQKETH